MDSSTSTAFYGLKGDRHRLVKLELLQYKHLHPTFHPQLMVHLIQTGPSKAKSKSKASLRPWCFGVGVVSACTGHNLAFRTEKVLAVFNAIEMSSTG